MADNSEKSEKVHWELIGEGTAFLFSEDYLLHKTGPGHPERPDRLEVIISQLKYSGVWENLSHIEPAPVDIKYLSQVHPVTYIERVREASRKGKPFLDSTDTPICKESYDVALLAAGGVCTAVDNVVDGNIANAFCAVRPPGHHAEREQAMGFCLFNNVAVGAIYARARYELIKAAIIDWDVHHGNGTQHIFESDPNVLYISLHQFPHYPGTGGESEKGNGKGIGTTMNFPMPPGAGDDEFLEVLRFDVERIIGAFQPDIFFISAGFDAHLDDSLSDLRLSEDGFAEMTRYIKRWANEYSSGRIISVLEGGYNLGSLRRSVQEHIKALLE